MTPTSRGGTYPGLTLLEYRAPVDGTSAAGHVREYAASLMRQIPRLVQLHLRNAIDVLQICQPPDLYFPVAALARGLGVVVLLDQRDLMPETFAQRYLLRTGTGDAGAALAGDAHPGARRREPDRQRPTCATG